ncbi:MAG: hypothetical protein AVDCRST_MAG14-2557 [uncultured Rubrobacteraceae bacterium]|uniref:Uncharacterized protein n=1 Tax=uncultured Rubrobacteraceae bacterium TaxID=349277 RepID=A0A6J4R546_9ACTN|nr:MAG: hypothetical protein AVDCRST_MAG14-2557 [uncultured Rubrobacteraceae bacterium]
MNKVHAKGGIQKPLRFILATIATHIHALGANEIRKSSFREDYS